MSASHDHQTLFAKILIDSKYQRAISNYYLLKHLQIANKWIGRLQLIQILPTTRKQEQN